MPPHAGLVHPKEYDIKDSNVELIGTELDHRVKYRSAQSEPAWNDGRVGLEPGLFVWRIEDFCVVPVARERDDNGLVLYDGDSYIVLHSQKIGQQQEQQMAHDVFFWLGAHTSQDEAGVAAYKTVELDEFLRGRAAQHREVQACPSGAFLALFPGGVTIRRGGVASGFRHVEPLEDQAETTLTLLRVFKHAGAPDGVLVHEVEPRRSSLDERDVFVLDAGAKIWVWHGKRCAPAEKAKAARLVHDMTIAKHVDVEVLDQTDGRARVVLELLGGGDDDDAVFESARPVVARDDAPRMRKLFRLSDASGELAFEKVKEGENVGMGDLNGDDVFLLDDGGRAIWVWEGEGASRAERAAWLRVAQAYARRVQDEVEHAYLIPIAKVRQGCESEAFLRALQ